MILTQQEIYGFILKIEAFDIDAIIVNINNFKSFKYKAKLLENTFAQSAANQTNGIQKDTAIAVPLKYQVIFGD